jgi:hypothetical protein
VSRFCNLCDSTVLKASRAKAKGEVPAVIRQAWQVLNEEKGGARALKALREVMAKEVQDWLDKGEIS